MVDSVPPRWGIVATIKAPVVEILDFAAHHLDLGADRIFIYLDDDNAGARAALAAHPKVDVTTTDDAYWQARLGRRPPKHQNRQGRNAEHAYGRADDLDWLAHIDVDEFLWPDGRVADLLAALPADCRAARMRPAEALAADGVGDAEPGLTWFKGFAPAKGDRLAMTQDVYPTYGLYLKGGFLSHVAGKMFARTRQGSPTLRIHNVFFDGESDPGEVELRQITVLHMHAHDVEKWRASYRFRLERGSYRDELKGVMPPEKGGMNLHQLFSFIEAESGEAGLEAFFDEVCRATPELRARLERHGLLRAHRLDLAQKRALHFPDWPA